MLLYASETGRKMREQLLGQAKLTAVEPEDMRQMEALVKRMAKRLATRYARKRHRAHRGNLDVRKTIRKSMGYGGVPFDIVWKTETIEKPKIVAICDVSRSVAAAAQFMLLFLYSLNEVIEKLEAFAFSDRLIRVGDILENEDLDAAIVSIIKKIGMRPTDYGRALPRLHRAAPRRPRPPHDDHHPRRRPLQLRQPPARHHARHRPPGAGGDLAESGAGDLLGAGRFADGSVQALLQRREGLQHAEPAGAHHRRRAAHLYAALKRRAPRLARKGWPGAARLLLPSAEPAMCGTAQGAMFAETWMSGRDEELLDIIAEEALIDRAKLDRSAKLEDIGLDSVDLVSVVFAIEEKYGIEIAEDAFARSDTLGAVLTKIDGLIDAKAA